MGAQEVSNFLGSIKETEISLERAGNLENGYWHELYDKWNLLDITEREELIFKQNPEVVARILILMMGEPKHNLQPKNEMKFAIVDLVIRKNPNTLTLHYSEGLPGWLIVLRRINIYEDSTLERLIRRIKSELYPGGYESDFSIHKAELDSMIRKTRR
jgi:hypothetical protein